MSLISRRANVLLVGCIVGIASCHNPPPPIVVPTPTPSVADEWLLFPEPLDGVAIGQTWNGSSVGSSCAQGNKPHIDTTGTSVHNARIHSSDASIAAKIAHIIGFGGDINTAQNVDVNAQGARVATGDGITPRFIPPCTPLRDGVPMYPIIDGLIAYDSMVVSVSNSGGQAANIDLSSKLKGIDTLAAKISRKDSNSYVRRTKNAWVGMHLFAVLADTSMSCTIRRVPAHGGAQCDDYTTFPLNVQANQASSGDFEVLVQGTGLDSIHRFTTPDGFAFSFGLPSGDQGTLGDWYQLRVAQDDQRGTAKVEITKYRYKVVRFLAEKDTTALRVFLQGR